MPELELMKHYATIRIAGINFDHMHMGDLPKFETRWGTFSDPWTRQPQPKCGFVLKGSEGAIASYDYEPSVRLQTQRNPAGKDVPVDRLKPPLEHSVQYVADFLRRDSLPEGPLSTKIARVGQRIVDSAVLSARTRKTMPLVP